MSSSKGVTRWSWLCIVFLQGIVFVQGQKVDLQCFAMFEHLLADQVENLVPCIKSLGYETPHERAEKYNCIMKCVMGKIGLINDDGSISLMKGIIFGLTHIENEYIERALIELAKCQDHASVNLADPSDTACLKMKPLVKCGIDFAFNLCKPGG